MSSSVEPPRPWKVMVVEDDLDSRTILAVLLTQRGWEPEVFADGRAAIAHASAHAIDLAIVDLHLADVAGEQVAREVRAAGASTTAALVALSGAVDPHWEVVRHFDAYLRKPVDPALLTKVVDELARAAQASRPPR